VSRTLASAAQELSERALGVPFGTLDPQLERSVNPRNRGWVGQWIERQLGLANGSGLLDFADGELKTFEVRDGWAPVHGQVAVAMIEDPDTLLAHPPFEESVVARKLERVLFAGYRKPTADPHDWHVAFVLVFEMARAQGVSVRLAESYDAIVRAFSADARHADEDAPARDLTYREELLLLKNKDSRQEGRYGANWSVEVDRLVTARRLGFYLRPQFFELLAANPHELAWHAAAENP
jgi:hypothetical protein